MQKGVMEIFKLIVKEEKYSDNNGAYDVLWLWDGKSISFDTLTGDMPEPAYERVTPEEKAQAADWYMSNVEPVRGVKMIGCKYRVKGSKKVKKGSIATVIDFYAGGYNSKYMRHDPERVKVSVDGEYFTISSNCLHEFVRGKEPYWHEVQGSLL